MLFTTYTFWIFFAIVATIYSRLQHRGQNVLLLIASYIFYGWWDWRFLGIMIFSTVIDYTVAKHMNLAITSRSKKHWLLLSLIVNLGLLAVFKYLGFALAQTSSLAHWLGYTGPWWLPHIVLPVGISFYTFQSLSYTIDVYRGVTKPAKHIWEFATYVSFFPQLVAGPIERSNHLLGQIANPRPPLNNERFREGLYYVMLGLFRKVVVADNIAMVVQGIFAKPTNELTAWEVLAGVYGFAFQIYGDFCGYSTIAQGVAKWLGVSLMDNFHQPYFARSPQDFWRRWHISLSTWLRDYLYISLGGSRHGPWKTARNLMLTMLLGGLWHGANWTFIIWGGFHGAWLVIHRLISQDKPVRNGPVASALKMLATFHLVCFGWLFFRAENVTQAFGMLARLAHGWTWSPLATYAFTLIAIYTIPLLIYETWVERRNDLLALTRVDWKWRALVYLIILFALIFFAPEKPAEFIYFQF